MCRYGGSIEFPEQNINANEMFIYERCTLITKIYEQTDGLTSINSLRK